MSAFRFCSRFLPVIFFLISLFSPLKYTNTGLLLAQEVSPADKLSSSEFSDILRDKTKFGSNVRATRDDIEDFQFTSVLRKDSPEFVLGKETGPNIAIASEDDPDMKFFLGIRYMGTGEYSSSEPISGGPSDSEWDFYGRRVRLEAGASFGKNIKFVMDLRNDRSNQDDRGEQKFNVGDAKVTFKKIFFNNSLLNAAMYRAKVDVSRSETVKSAFLINYDRAAIADSAANWISENRRASNFQLFGDWKKKVHYSLAVGDGVSSSGFRDAKGNRAAEIGGQSNPMFGGKIRFSPFDGWEETKRTETYFGQGKHLSLGLGHFLLNGVDFETADGKSGLVDRELTNAEFSAHYKGVFFQAEYFDFGGAVADFEAENLQFGDSKGWYALAEYVMPDLYFLSPFVRYDKWDTFSDLDGFERETLSLGLNCYLRGNTSKVGLVYERDEREENIGGKDTDTFRVISQFFF